MAAKRYTVARDVGHEVYDDYGADRRESFRELSNSFRRDARHEMTDDFAEPQSVRHDAHEVENDYANLHGYRQSRDLADVSFTDMNYRQREIGPSERPRERSSRSMNGNKFDRYSSGYVSNGRDANLQFGAERRRLIWNDECAPITVDGREQVTGVTAPKQRTSISVGSPPKSSNNTGTQLHKREQQITPTEKDFDESSVKTPVKQNSPATMAAEAQSPSGNVFTSAIKSAWNLFRWRRNSAASDDTIENTPNTGDDENVSRKDDDCESSDHEASRPSTPTAGMRRRDVHKCPVQCSQCTTAIDVNNTGYRPRDGRTSSGDFASYRRYPEEHYDDNVSRTERRNQDYWRRSPSYDNAIRSPLRMPNEFRSQGENLQYDRAEPKIIRNDARVGQYSNSAARGDARERSVRECSPAALFRRNEYIGVRGGSSA